MAGIFPQSVDGGLPHNPDQPHNPTQSIPLETEPTGTAALWYGNGCDVRLRPHVINSLISEIAATADIAQVSYDPSRLTNLQLATRYLIQRGLPRAAGMMGGPNAYTATLDPTATGYNNYMTLTVVPQTTNAGPVTLNIDGRGAVPVLRNDGVPLRQGDFGAGLPKEIIYYEGNWYCVGPVTSQLPTFDLLVSIFDASATWTVPVGVTSIQAELWGGGGGGGSGNGTTGGGGGGGGEYGLGFYRVTPGGILVLTIGAGGLGANVGGNRGQPGGVTSLAISGGALLMTAMGGGGGTLPNEQGSGGGTGGIGGAEMIAGSGGFMPTHTTWGSAGSPGGGTTRGRLYAMQGNSGLPPGGGGSGNDSINDYSPTMIMGAPGRVKLTYPRTT